MRSDLEFWKEVRRQVLTGELSQRAAMKQYGLGWHTLKKILTHDEPPGYRQRKPRTKRKLEPFLPIIRQILEMTGRGSGGSGTRPTASSNGCVTRTATPAAR